MKKEKQKNYKGFTLLELLVVVLIIGTLAAIALPQYQMAVDKTKFSTYQTWVKSINDAYKRYILVHNDAPTDIEQIDLDLPAGYSKFTPSHQSCAVFDDIFCCINYPEAGYQYGGTVCGKKDLSFAYGENTAVPGNINISSFSRYCIAKTEDTRYIKLCENMPYYESFSGNLPTQYGHLTGYTYYQLI